MYSTETLKEMTHEELCVLLENGDITWNQWVLAQPDTYGDYNEWLAARGLMQDEENAMDYVRYMEHKMMDAQMDGETSAATRTLDMARRILDNIR